MLTVQIGAEVQINFDPDGLRVIVSVPLPDAPRQAEPLAPHDRGRQLEGRSCPAYTIKVFADVTQFRIRDVTYWYVFKDILIIW